MKNTNNYIIVSDQEAMEQFLYMVDNFHDTILREVTIVSRGYVAKNGAMVGDAAPSDVRLLFQLQWDEAPCVELIFENIDVFTIEPNLNFSPKGLFTKEGKIEFYLYGKSNKGFCMPSVIARTLKYRILGKEFWGNGFLIAKPIPREKEEWEA